MAPVAPLFHPLPSYADAAGSSLHQRGGTPHPTRAISGPLTPVSSGQPRASRSIELPSSTVLTARCTYTFQAGHAGSIPVAPALHAKGQVIGHSRHLALRAPAAKTGGRAINVPLSMGQCRVPGRLKRNGGYPIES